MNLSKLKKEYNVLVVENIEDFFETYFNNKNHYKSRFEILADLERQVKYKTLPDRTILCQYKKGGDVIFDLQRLELKNNVWYVVYRYSTIIS